LHPAPRPCELGRWRATREGPPSRHAGEMRDARTQATPARR
jgi:hypothetical protein